jgi:hypothetical protein
VKLFAKFGFVILLVALVAFIVRRERLPANKLWIDSVRSLEHDRHIVKAHNSKVQYELVCKDEYSSRCFIPMAGHSYDIDVWKADADVITFTDQRGDQLTWRIETAESR